MVEINNKIIEDFIKGDKKGLNKSTVYLLPMLGTYESDFKGNSYSNLFQNCFIGDRTLPENDEINQNKILLRYRFSGKLEYRHLERMLTRHIEYVTNYEVDRLHTMYVFNVPLKWESDYNKFKEWKPSQFSQEYKDHMLKFYGFNSNSRLYKVLYKTEDLFLEMEKQYEVKIPRDQEASSIPNFEEIEYFRKEFKEFKFDLGQVKRSFIEDDGN